MSEDRIILRLAKEKGFLNAATIKPAHLVHKPDKCPIIEIPAEAELYVSSEGNVFFKFRNVELFPEVGKRGGFRWMGMVYDCKKDKWAEIVTHRVGNTEWKSKTIGELSEFPSEGVCWQPTKELRDYLLARSNSSTTACGFHVKGIAWNYNSCWEVASYSGKTEYKIEHLMRFIPPNIPEHLNQRPMTPDECYEFPEKWFIMIDKENVYDVQDFLIAKKDEYVGYTDTWKPSPGGSLLYPQHTRWAYGITGRPLEKGYTEITYEQFMKHIYSTLEATPIPFSVRNGYRLPDKWCIHNNPLNHEIVDAFMKEHRKEWGSYTEQWTTKGSHGYFHYPPFNQVCHSEDKPEEGYTLITTQQFKKYVLTHTEKNQFTNNLNLQEDGKSTEFRGSRESTKGESCKVQRPHLSIRGGSEIRATSIGCSKIQIQVRDGYSADNL